MKPEQEMLRNLAALKAMMDSDTSMKPEQEMLRNETELNCGIWIAQPQ